jgi:nicotinate dehydrogenase subunit B
MKSLTSIRKVTLMIATGTATSLDWATYPILTFPEVLEIVIELIDWPTEKPWGAGEPAAAVISSSISNAVFDATGVRRRSVPFKREKVRAAVDIHNSLSATGHDKHKSLWRCT